MVKNGVDDAVDIYSGAGGTVADVRGRCGGVNAGGVQLATHPEFHCIVLGDVTVPPQVESRALGVLLSGAILGHQCRQSAVTNLLH